MVGAHFYKGTDIPAKTPAEVEPYASIMKPFLHPYMLQFVVMHYQARFDQDNINQMEKTKETINNHFACPNFDASFTAAYNSDNVKAMRGE